MDDNFFPLRLSQLREQKGLSARDMGLSIGYGESYINQIENKRKKPSFDAFYLICEILGITPKDFFDEGKKYPERLNALVENLEKLDDKALMHVSGIVELIVKNQN